MAACASTEKNASPATAAAGRFLIGWHSHRRYLTILSLGWV
jgi:hypothetical protein